MAENGVSAAREDACPASAQPADGAMADCIHAYVEWMQPSSANDSLNRALAEPALDQLPVGDDAVL